MSTNNKKNWQVFLASMLLTGALSVALLSGTSLSDEDIRTPMRLTAQIAFGLYLVVLVARPLQQLLRQDWTAALLRNRRLIGVAFAATMTTHLVLIVYRFESQAELEFSLDLFGVGAYAIFYAMLITSFDGPKKAIGPKAWKLLHRVGLIWAAVIFGLPRSLDDLTDPDYLKFGIPFAIAILIRFTAWLRSRQRGS
jgi:sulfoxide reductase heme-binding subunit YedZ